MVDGHYADTPSFRTGRIKRQLGGLGAYHRTTTMGGLSAFFRKSFVSTEVTDIENKGDTLDLFGSGQRANILREFEGAVPLPCAVS